MDCCDIFNPENTQWETDCGEMNLVYKGDMEELSKETGIEEDKLYELLGEYEDYSKEEIEYQEDVARARRGGSPWV